MPGAHPAPLTWALAFASILLSAVAQLLMKIGMGETRPALNDIGGFVRIALNPFVLGGLACYGVSAVIWLIVLSKMPLSMAYPLVAVAIALVVIASSLLLGEPLPAGRLVGAGLIVAGVAVIGLRG